MKSRVGRVKSFKMIIQGKVLGCRFAVSEHVKNVFFFAAIVFEVMPIKDFSLVITKSAGKNFTAFWQVGVNIFLFVQSKIKRQNILMNL